MKQKLYAFVFLGVLLLCLDWTAIAQPRPRPLDVARHYWANGQADSALVAYRVAYEEAPFDVKIYEEYLEKLSESSRYDEAQKLVEYMQEIRRNDPAITLDLADVLAKKGDQRGSRKVLSDLIENGAKLSDFDLKKLGDALIMRRRNEEALKLYELAAKAGRQAFDSELIRLYLETGNLEKVFPVYHRMYPYQQGIEQDIRARLALILENKPELRPQIEASLKKLSTKDRENKSLYASLMSWLAQQDGSQAEVLDQLIALDRKDRGSTIAQIMETGRSAFDNRSYTAANKAFDYIVRNAEDPHYKAQASRFLLQSQYHQLASIRPIDTAMVRRTEQMMHQYFNHNPEAKTQIEYLWYMDVLGKYNKNPEEAARLLTEVVEASRVSKEYLGMAKLAIGDYQLLSGKVWEANLAYAQVDKLFKQDKMGEEARYKQALLAFYRGDFTWSQTQLNVLKASTTELIANDAMNLSVMITENTVTDTSAVPLKMFAAADLMIFQYQYQEADSILNALLAQFPESDLIDDIWMLQASIAKEEGDFSKALKLYSQVAEQYKEGVLADDAMMQMGEIQELYLKDKSAARKVYEDLILEFPGSTLAGTARNRLAAINLSETP